MAAKISLVSLGDHEVLLTWRNPLRCKIAQVPAEGADDTGRVTHDSIVGCIATLTPRSINGLDILLARLKMNHLGAAVDSVCEHAAKEELNYREFLVQALSQEWNDRHQKGLESRLKQARLPWVKTLEQFDFIFQPGIDHKVVRKLAGLAFVERSEHVILPGLLTYPSPP